MYSIDQADIIIDLASQTLALPKRNKFYVISTAKNGIGEQEGSEKTPRGWHRIAHKIGADAPLNAVFKARQQTGEIYSQQLADQHPDRDWILTRILWLDGLEEGLNRGKGHDTLGRYIYIHGTPDTEPMGIPVSHGCIRMHGQQLMEVFDLVDDGALVYLSEDRVD
ncbi:cell wall-recycling L,D-carboxypeptidase ElsL [Acinetobacter sp. WZC-1]|uniref:cell wall-recycling L,D-carboxypeptidase ElsL n=1 Tax=Acinetobacter sp. WZC-1 TaxID=3459034 RepID=UPI00403DD979